ncbi:MAG TPA: N-acetylmuramic acid 6-phosphate etherase [Fimbriimonadaceae bacterium]|nr:N-acetylmuramic acid 6-phosphate etherase [Fimbriimonadaceae bacterium]HRJ33570.1 N-acetylmuramic acid 6-phosphate etherase [Fimbriimonadaceae bacterium]
MNTESRNPRSFGLDRMSAKEIVRLMNEEELIVWNVMKQAEEKLAVTAEKVAEAYLAGGRIVYVGAGTSGRIAAADAAEMPPTFGIPEDRFIAILAGGEAAQSHAVEHAEDDEHAAITAINQLRLTRKDVVIGLTASGRTPFVVAAVRHARQKGVWTCGLSNSARAALLKEADLGILLETGPEVLTGSTRLKAGTSQKLALNRISTAAMVLVGKVIENLMVDVQANNRKLEERCVRILRALVKLSESEAWDLLRENDFNIRAAMEAYQATRQPGPATTVPTGG